VELLEPLVPSIKNNLENRHTYVRRNAVLAIFSIYRSFDYLLPDAPEIIFNFLQKVPLPLPSFPHLPDSLLA
jgi:coatomer subunit beta